VILEELAGPIDQEMFYGHPFSEAANLSASVSNIKVEHPSEDGIEEERNPRADQLAKVGLEVINFAVIVPSR